MTLEWAELVLAAMGTIIMVVGGIHSWLKARENRMQVVIDDIRNQIDTLKTVKVDQEDMREYVQLWTKPITDSISTLTDETKRTRELMEKIYHEGNKR